MRPTTSTALTLILDLKSGNGTNNYLRFKNSGGTVAGGVYGSGTSFGLLDADSNWAIKHDRDNRTGFFINNGRRDSLLTLSSPTYQVSERRYSTTVTTRTLPYLDGSSNLSNLSANTTTLARSSSRVKEQTRPDQRPLCDLSGSGCLV